MNNRFIKLTVIFLLISTTLFAQQATVISPNQKIKVSLLSGQDSNDKWHLKAEYLKNGAPVEVISRINLGLSRSDQDFNKDLKILKTSKPVFIKEEYAVLHGKKSLCSNQANEIVVSFENPSKAKMNVIIRAYDDGMTFRYEFPEKSGTYLMKDEFTSFEIEKDSPRWMEKWNPANEAVYTEIAKDKVEVGEWSIPALFQEKGKECWFMIHEADLDETYCGAKLSNQKNASSYKITFPNQGDGRGMGASQPTISLPWKSPWRVVIMGDLSDIVSSTLVDDVSPPSVIKNADWVKPGLVSWNYWSSNHGTKDFKVVTAFADLAAQMNWPYTLLDWEWDRMENGGNLQDAIKYILSIGVKPLIWYNSGGEHTWVSSTPKDRMLTHENRVAEFTKLKEMGIVGVKIDFFESEKQDMIKYYLDILKDAAKFEMMVYFHGCLVPRGWARTYPNLMTYEAVRGAEWYNNVPDFTMAAPSHNAALPFTRNVVGGMDYTPVTFTNSQYPHITSYAHELALSVLFESGLQHMADRPEGYNALPDGPKEFLRNVPSAWDDIKLIDGHPGKDVALARRKGKDWYIAGINGEIVEKRKKLPLNFLEKDKKYRLTLITDGNHDKDFKTQYSEVDRNTVIDLKMLRRGGFAGVLTPVF